jgi:hypothetical protein
MRRYVSVHRTAAGVTTVTVSLVDGDLSSKYAVKTYTGKISEAVALADKYALGNLQGLRDGSDGVR